MKNVLFVLSFIVLFGCKEDENTSAVYLQLISNEWKEDRLILADGTEIPLGSKRKETRSIESITCSNDLVLEVDYDIAYITNFNHYSFRKDDTFLSQNNSFLEVLDVDQSTCDALQYFTVEANTVLTGEWSLNEAQGIILIKGYNTIDYASYFDDVFTEVEYSITYEFKSNELHLGLDGLTYVLIKK